MRTSLNRLGAIFAAFASGYLVLCLGFLPGLAFDKLGRSWLPAMVPAASLLSLVFGLAFARFLLRAAPIRFDGRRRYVVLGVALYFVGLGGASSTLLVLLIDPAEGSPLATGLNIQGISHALIRTLWFAAILVPFVVRHLAPGRFLDRPFILYLRRFSSFSDRSVVAAVLSRAPAGKPVAFLVPSRSTAHDWNPFRIAFAGFKLKHPLRSLPLELTSSSDWEQAIDVLLARAETVVVDLSQLSPSIEVEMAKVRDGDFLKKTVILAEAECSTDAEVLADASAGGAQVIRYQRTWIGAWRTLTAGVPAAVLAAFLATSPIWYIVFLLTQNIYLREMVALFACVAAWVYYVLFWRPALDSESTAELGIRLQTSTRGHEDVSSFASAGISRG